MLDCTIDLTHLIVTFAIIVCTTPIATALQSCNDEAPQIPCNIIADMVFATIREDGVASLCMKRPSAPMDDPEQYKKPKLIDMTGNMQESA